MSQLCARCGKPIRLSRIYVIHGNGYHPRCAAKRQKETLAWLAGHEPS